MATNVNETTLRAVMKANSLSRSEALRAFDIAETQRVGLGTAIKRLTAAPPTPTAPRPGEQGFIGPVRPTAPVAGEQGFIGPVRPPTLTRDQQLINIRKQLADAQRQAQSIATSVGTLAKAEQGGLNITRTTTVQDATRFLRELQQQGTSLDISLALSETGSLSAQFLATTPDQKTLQAEIDRIGAAKAEVGTGLSKLIGQRPTPISAEEIQRQEKCRFRLLGFGLCSRDRRALGWPHLRWRRHSGL